MGQGLLECVKRGNFSQVARKMFKGHVFIDNLECTLICKQHERCLNFNLSEAQTHGQVQQIIVKRTMEIIQVCVDCTDIWLKLFL